MATPEPLPDWEREFLQNQHVAPPEKCDHAWASKHQPGHLLYWVRQCMLCHEVDWDDLDTEIGKLTMATPADYEYRVLRIPRGTGIDGAIVELHTWPNGLVTMDIRIPARNEPGPIRDMSGCLCAYTWNPGGDGIVRNGPRADCPVHGDEDRIRDAMTEAQDHG